MGGVDFNLFGRHPWNMSNPLPLQAGSTKKWECLDNFPLLPGGYARESHIVVLSFRDTSGLLRLQNPPYFQERRRHGTCSGRRKGENMLFPLPLLFGVGCEALQSSYNFSLDSISTHHTSSFDCLLVFLGGVGCLEVQIFLANSLACIRRGLHRKTLRLHLAAGSRDRTRKSQLWGGGLFSSRYPFGGFEGDIKRETIFYWREVF